jgi:ABC-type nitrate/sulfonate/bicarbonate transport system substrate-binding protein
LRRLDWRLALLVSMLAAPALLQPALAQPAAPSSASPKLEKLAVHIAVGGKASLYYLPLTLAEQLGYFKAEGLEVKISDFAGGSQSLRAVIGGSADVVSGAYEHTINMQASSGEVDKERQARAMADPEIQAILGDAQMRSILGEMQTDPKKAQAAMQDPVISAKLQKLIAAGVLQVR